MTAYNVTLYSSASDGDLQLSSTVSYNTVWTGTTDPYILVNNSGTYGPFYSGQSYYSPSGTWTIQRGFVYFDTSAIPSNATITAATLSLYGSYDYSTTDFLLTIQTGGGTYPHDPMVQGDYNKANYSSDGGSFNTTGWSVTAYNDITLNATGLSWINIGDGAVTKFCLRSSREIAGTAPSGNEMVAFYPAEQGGNYRPKLYVEYTAPGAPTVTTQAVTDITDTTATGNGNVTDDGGDTITERGTCISTSPNPTINETKDTKSGTTGAFTTSIDTLTPGLTYHVRAFATNAIGTGYGSDVNFTTLTSPTVSTQAVTNIASTTATGNGNVTNDGGDTITERGVCYCLYTHGTPDTGDSTKTAAGTTGAFTASLTSLSRATKYNIRAYATNSYGTSYGVLAEFTTLAESPTVTTQAASAILDTSATGNGTITDTGGENCTERGICWNLTGTPTITDNYIHEDGSFSTGAFTASLINLPSSDTIYARAYAANTIGGSYGSEVNFDTLAPISTEPFTVPICAIAVRMAALYFENTVPFTVPICEIDCTGLQPYVNLSFTIPICSIDCTPIQGLHSHLLNHPIISPEYLDEPKLVNRVYVVGVDADGNTIYGEDKDTTINGEVLQIYPDSMITTADDADTIAGNILAKARLSAPRGQITIPPALQMELWDVIKIDDAICNQDDDLYRVAGWQFTYQVYIPNQQESKYEHIVKLTAV